MDCECTTRDCLEACRERIRQEIPYLREVPEPFREAVVIRDCDYHHGCGLLYRLTPSGGFTRLHDFSSQGGFFPMGSLVETPNGDLYGVTLRGGRPDRDRLRHPQGWGTIFRFTPTSGQLTTVYTFDRAESGAHPKAEMILGPDGALYGTTSESVPGAGTVFRVDPHRAP